MWKDQQVVVNGESAAYYVVSLVTALLFLSVLLTVICILIHAENVGQF